VWMCVCVGVKEVYDGPAARLACPLPPSDAPADALTPGLASPMTTKAVKDKGNLRSAHLPFASTQYRVRRDTSCLCLGVEPQGRTTRP
jgi:hypothetical protein